ncbi:MAG TPA: response regulator [Candidatus Limnocylindrales bacterium]|nr:response regulator [Candidatus Limnocylindrales bacterium]
MRSWLVVEDEPSIYDVLHTMFQMWGVEGIAYNDGEEAIAYIEDVDSGKFRGELPELAVIDIRLPGKADGVAVGARLRQSPKLKHIAIVLITAYVLGEASQQDHIERAGADDLIEKPLPRPAEFRRRLEAVIEARRPLAPPEAPTAPLLPAVSQTRPARTSLRPFRRPHPSTLPEMDDDDSETREQTKDLPRLKQADADTQPAPVEPGLRADPNAGGEQS